MIHPTHKTQTANTPSPTISPPKKNKLSPSPFIRFDDQKGILFIKKKLESNVHSVSNSLIDLIKIYLSDHSHLKCYFLFKEMNLQTLQVLFKLFREIRSLNATNNIEIIWFADYQNKNIIETGIDFADMYDLNINILSV